jgi:O-antigen ligase
VSTSAPARESQESVGGRLRTLWSGMHGIRGLMIGATPLLIEAISPNRVTFSVLVAALYLVAAVVLARHRPIDRALIVYAVVAIAFIALAILRMETIDPLNTAQRTYGLAKGLFVIEVDIPLGVAVALMVWSLDDLRPAAIVFVVVGVLIAVASVITRNDALLGVGRYTTQGNLIAVAGLILCQFWIVRNFRAGALLALLTFVATLIVASRQSVSAFGIGIGFTAVYWFLADRRRRGAAPTQRFWLIPTVMYGAVVLGLLTWAFLTLQPWIPMPREITNPVTCNCIVGRFIDLGIHPGGRTVMVQQGWTLFAGHPLVGGGLGSFVGLAPYDYPHNIVLEVAGEMGLLGVVVLFVPLLAGWLKLVATGIRTGSQAAATLAAIVLAYAVVANLSGDLASQRGLWLYGLVALKMAWRPSSPEAGARRAVPK